MSGEDSVRERLARMEERHGRIEDKLDYLITSHTEEKANRAMICDQHRRRTDKILDDVDSLKTWRTALVGAWSVASVIGIIVWDRLKAKINIG